LVAQIQKFPSRYLFRQRFGGLRFSEVAGSRLVQKHLTGKLVFGTREGVFRKNALPLPLCCLSPHLPGTISR